MNGHTTEIVTDRHRITTTVQRHRVTLTLSRHDVAVLVGALALAAGEQTLAEAQRTQARDLLWQIVDDAAGPSRTIDRRTPEVAP